MKIRYKHTNKGFEQLAKVYSDKEHKIAEDKIDVDAIRILEKLNTHGYPSYLVGGAVRDLMLGHTPKDFDIVTQASPREVHKLFRNSRIIGKRFRIVHVFFGSKIFEVSTFRSLKEHDDDSDNLFGSIEEDAKRRDFSINSLYYDYFDRTVIDFNNSIKDFKFKKIRSLIPLDKTFIEDPVRMIRAIKCSVITGFRIEFCLKLAIRKYASQLTKVSSSRLTEELSKILSGGFSSQIISRLAKYGLLVYVLPCISVFEKNKNLYLSLDELDKQIQHNKLLGKKELSESDQLLALTSNFIVFDEKTPILEQYSNIYRQIKVLLTPNTPPNSVIEEATLKFMKKNRLQIPKFSKESKKTGQRSSNSKESKRKNYARRCAK